MEGCFMSQWGHLFFRRGDFIYKCGGEGLPQGPLVLMEGGFEKKFKMRGAPAPSMPPTTTMGNRVDVELLLCMLSSVVHVLCMYVLFYKYY